MQIGSRLSVKVSKAILTDGIILLFWQLPIKSANSFGLAVLHLICFPQTNFFGSSARVQ